MLWALIISSYYSMYSVYMLLCYKCTVEYNAQYNTCVSYYVTTQPHKSFNNVKLKYNIKPVETLKQKAKMLYGHVFFKWSKSHFVCHLEICGRNILAHSSK